SSGSGRPRARPARARTGGPPGFPGSWLRHRDLGPQVGGDPGAGDVAAEGDPPRAGERDGQGDLPGPLEVGRYVVEQPQGQRPRARPRAEHRGRERERLGGGRRPGQAEPERGEAPGAGGGGASPRPPRRWGGAVARAGRGPGGVGLVPRRGGVIPPVPSGMSRVRSRTSSTTRRTSRRAVMVSLDPARPSADRPATCIETALAVAGRKSLMVPSLAGPGNRSCCWVGPPNPQLSTAVTGSEAS